MSQGYRAYALFVIQMKGVHRFEPQRPDSISFRATRCGKRQKKASASWHGLLRVDGRSGAGSGDTCVFMTEPADRIC